MITIVYGDYWVNIYKDDERVWSGHRPTIEEVLKAIGENYETHTYDSEEDQFDFDAEMLSEALGQ